MSDFKEELRIVPFALDEEWLKQPLLVMEVTERAALARQDVEEAKLALDVEQAEADSYFRKNPEKLSVPKVTETVISNAVAMKKEVIDAKENVINARLHMNVLDGAVSAFDSRKKALENLVVLHGRDYFSQPIDRNPNPVNRDELVKKQARKKAGNKK